MGWKETIATVAPTIATAIGGPLGGVAVKLASAALGVEASEEAIEKSLAKGNPDALLMLKKAENDFTTRMEELGIERDRLAHKNVDSARKMQLGTKSWVPPTLTIITVVGFFGLLIGAAFGKLNLTGSDTMLILLGVLARETASVYNFWFGSSQSSKDKTSLLGTKNEQTNHK